jgi:hypothetical protein
MTKRSGETASVAKIGKPALEDVRVEGWIGAALLERAAPIEAVTDGGRASGGSGCSAWTGAAASARAAAVAPHDRRKGRRKELRNALIWRRPRIIGHA